MSSRKHFPPRPSAPSFFPPSFDAVKNAQESSEEGEYPSHLVGSVPGLDGGCPTAFLSLPPLFRTQSQRKVCCLCARSPPIRAARKKRAGKEGLLKAYEEERGEWGKCCPVAPKEEPREGSGTFSLGARKSPASIINNAQTESEAAEEEKERQKVPSDGWKDFGEARKEEGRELAGKDLRRPSISGDEFLIIAPPPS